MASVWRVVQQIERVVFGNFPNHLQGEFSWAA